MRIRIGSYTSKCCATCQYWQGNAISSAGTANPADMEVNSGVSARCLKKGPSLQRATNRCSQHEYNYACQRYE